MIDERAMRIVDDAVEGKTPSRSDIMHLLRFDAYSVEAAYACARAREVGMKACGGRGYVFAQIGVDENPCPENCLFCDMAAANTRPDDIADPKASLEVPIGRIVHYAKLFEGAGVDGISLVSTAGLGFERYLDMVRAVKASVSQTPIVANTGDLSMEQAHALRDAGAEYAYHAVRLGEGEMTSVKPLDRRRTIRHLRVAGIKLMTGIEPVWDGVDPLDLSERIVDIPDFSPYCIGVRSYEPSAHDGMGKRKPAKTGMLRYVAALVRLACGEGPTVGGIGGVAWVDAGTNPRKGAYGADDAALVKQVEDARERLALDGFSR